MRIGRVLNQILDPFSVRLVRKTAPVEVPPDPPQPVTYDQDGLRTIHNHDFMTDPAFQRAYERGMAAVGGHDYFWHWRVHVGLWAASCARRLEGDFVECGVNRGFLSSAIMEYLHWDSLGRTFYLLDTFRGLDERHITDDEREDGVLERGEYCKAIGFYVTNVEEVRANFSQWKNVKIIEGSVPDTLDHIDSRCISFVHLDMNCSRPEVDAAEFLWDRLVTGAMVLLDDYAYHGYQSQKEAMDEFARKKSIEVLSLPTGQGLLVKR